MTALVLEVQPTPNPNAVKFLLNHVIAFEPRSFTSREQAAGDPVAARLLGIDGVTSVLLLGDFVTVNKRPDVRWDAIRGKVQEILTEN